MNTYGHACVDLELHIMNDAATYRAYYLPVALRLQKRWRSGEFSLDAGIRGMLNAVTAAAQDYHRGHGSMTEAWHHAYSPSDRRQVAETLVRSLVAEWRLQNWLTR